MTKEVYKTKKDGEEALALLNQTIQKIKNGHTSRKDANEMLQNSSINGAFQGLPLNVFYMQIEYIKKKLLVVFHNKQIL